MADILTFITTALDLATKVHGIVEDLKGADDLIDSAGTNLKNTVATLEDLKNSILGFEQDPTLEESALRSALVGCQNACSKFEDELERCTRHSKSGQLSRRDRFQVALFKKSKFKEFNENLATQRQILLVGLGVLNIRCSNQTAASLKEFQKTTGDAIKSLLGQIDILERLKERLDSDQAKRDIEDQVSVLQKQLGFCQQSLNNVQQKWSQKQVVRDTRFEDTTHTFVGNDMSHASGHFEQDIINTDHKRSAFAFVGAFGQGTVGAVSSNDRNIPQAQSQPSTTGTRPEIQVQSTTSSYQGKGHRLGRI